MRFILNFFASAAVLFSALTVAAQDAPYLNKNLSPEQRAEDLLGRLTLTEKASLMDYNSPAIPRLGIPAYNWWNEALHGVARNGYATMYPMPIGMAASFDPELIEEVFTSVSDEARVKYRLARTVETRESVQYAGLTFWTPNINIFRDPRWGRGMETYGEDPYLTGLLGSAVVRGLQGDFSDGHLKAQACAKHFAVHSGPESLRHTFDANVSERDLWETYLAAFKDLVMKAGVQEVMFAYNRFEGYPCGASKRLLQDILRDEWGYKGLIVSDCWAVSDFVGEQYHNWAKTREEAIAAATLAGMDVECGNMTNLLPAAVSQGLLKETDIDEHVKRLLAVRFALGEMDFESPWDNIPESVLCSEEHKAQSLDIARKSLVLLKNDGILPLADDAKVALVGPNAADSVMMWGNYEGVPKRTVTLYDALKARVPELKYVKGCPHAAELDTVAVDVARNEDECTGRDDVHQDPVHSARRADGHSLDDGCDHRQQHTRQRPEGESPDQDRDVCRIVLKERHRRKDRKVDQIYENNGNSDQHAHLRKSDGGAGRFVGIGLCHVVILPLVSSENVCRPWSGPAFELYLSSADKSTQPYNNSPAGSASSRRVDLWRKELFSIPYFYAFRAGF